MRKSVNSIIFFGGSNTQSSAVKQLKSLNYKIILIDKNKNCFCKKYCDYFINISHSESKKIKNKIKILKKKEKLNVKKYYAISDIAYKAINNIFKIKEYEKFIYKNNTKNLIHNFLDTPKFLILGKKREILKNYISLKKKFRMFLKKTEWSKFLLKPSHGISSLGIKIFKSTVYIFNLIITLCYC